MNRRRFLRRPPVALLPAPPDADLPLVPAGYALVRVSRRAMATTFEVALPFRSHPSAVAAAEAALDLIDALEDQMTVYRDAGEVAELNAVAAAGPVVVEGRLFDLLSACAGWTRETDGAFDIAAGALVKAWGFYRREGRVPTPRERVEAMARTGMRHVILDAEQRSVKYRVPGLELNLGAVGKGYALDRAAELLRNEWGVRSALLHAGGSSVYAIGHPPGEVRGWPIRLRHPDADQERSLGTVWLRDQGLGTSAATFQSFAYNGRTLGHLLDPRTGRPADGTASASATAPTAAEADAMSTAAFVFGAAGAETLTRTRPHLTAVVLGDQEPLPPTPSPKKGGGARLSRPLAPPPFLGEGVGGRGLRTFNLSPVEYTPD